MANATLFGIHAVQSALTHRPKSVVKLWLTDSRRDQRLTTLNELAQNLRIEVVRLSAKEFKTQFGDANHQGAVAECLAREPLSEPELLTLVTQRENVLLLVLDGVTDPHNFGALLRTADAAGVDAVITPRNGSVGLTSVVRKVASGAAETMAVCTVANLARTLGELKSLGVWLYGASDAAERDYSANDYTGSVALVLGAEGKGIRRLTRDACDVLISIPMAGSVSSLNVSVAAGVCLFEVARQRRAVAR